MRKGNFFALFFNFESRCKNTVTLLIVDSHAHRALRFGTYRTVVLGLQLPLLEKIAALVFHSTNLTADGTRLISGSCRQKIPLHEVSEAIEKKSSTFF